MKDFRDSLGQQLEVGGEGKTELQETWTKERWMNWGGIIGGGRETQENQLSLQTWCVLSNREVPIMSNSLARASAAPVLLVPLLS